MTVRLNYCHCFQEEALRVWSDKSDAARGPA